MGEDKTKIDLNPFPTSPKPIFIRIGLLFVGVICLWLFLHYLDKNGNNDNAEESVATKKTQTQPSPDSKHKIPQGGDE